ncbi:hypothetical protein SAMN02800694_1883 [Luteibacter sp. UNCMF331Sha3.1]|uniref:hypothetical protein n=1 Tax=Luteibacter sp. UNCMF331Sha3.1 TaxID=1502760 RepID=UPI0008C19CAD|nr:hypothetical protein [Luteibacter sp. UNCMF331Sha3.1]SEM84573.1 hypothetical protein SAMN02800694_1883 [Luteibacter sp. UNCMF331Sha3.1]
MKVRIYLVGMAFSVASPAPATDITCGENAFRQQVAETASRTVHSEPVQPIVGEFPTDEGTPECIRVAFRLSPSGTPWNVRTPESSGSFAFNLAAMRAFAKYRFKGSWWRFLEPNVVILRGVENRKPANWHSPTP